MFTVLTNIVNFMAFLERETSSATVHIKSRTGEFGNTFAVNAAECSMIELILSLIIFAKTNSSFS